MIVLRIIFLLIGLIILVIIFIVIGFRIRSNLALLTGLYFRCLAARICDFDHRIRFIMNGYIRVFIGTYNLNCNLRCNGGIFCAYNSFTSFLDVPDKDTLFAFFTSTLPTLPLFVSDTVSLHSKTIVLSVTLFLIFTLFPFTVIVRFL